MTGQLTRQPVYAPESAYAIGQHCGWEVDAHQAERESFEKTGQYWTLDYRKRWLERYFTITPYMVAYRIDTCAWCVSEKESLLLGDKKVSEGVQALRNEIRKLARRFASKLAAKHRHIDSF